MLKGSPVLLCGTCTVRPDVPEGAKPDDAIECPNCGATATVARALSQARHHATHQAARALDRQDKSFASARVPTRAPLKALDWISGLSSD